MSLSTVHVPDALVCADLKPACHASQHAVRCERFVNYIGKVARNGSREQTTRLYTSYRNHSRRMMRQEIAFGYQMGPFA